MAFGPLGLTPAAFWRLTLAEWRAMLDGYDQRKRIEMRERAWTVSHLLVAAGCDAEKVTIAKLQGEPEPKGHVPEHERKRREAEKIWRRVQRDNQKRGGDDGTVKDTGVV